MNVENDDWRLQNQADCLTRLTLSWKTYRSPRPDWEHDHCEFCWAKFAEIDDAEALHEGYTTHDNYRWICAPCATDFKQQFGWTCIGGPLSDSNTQ